MTGVKLVTHRPPGDGAVSCLLPGTSGISLYRAAKESGLWLVGAEDRMGSKFGQDSAHAPLGLMTSAQEE